MRAYLVMPKKLRRPREILPGECCGSGCTRCVWDVYYDELMVYEEQKKKLLHQACSGTDDDSDEDCDSENSSEAEECATNYIGSVVIKYLEEGPTMCEVAKASKRIEEHLESRFVPLKNVKLVCCSDSHWDSPSVNVISVELAHEIPSPVPGDVVDIFISNDDALGPSAIEHLCKRLMVNPNTWCELRRSPFVPADHFPPWLPLNSPITVHQLLSNYVDISSCSYLLRPVFFQSLLRIYNNNLQKGWDTTTCDASTSSSPGTPALLLECASPEASPGIFKQILNAGKPLSYPYLADVLDLFSFVKLPLERMLEITGPLQPRRFSVSGFQPSTSSSPIRIELCIRQVIAERNANLTESTIGGTALQLSKLLNHIAECRVQKPGTRSALFHGHVSNPLSWEARGAVLGGQRQTPARQIFLGFSLFGTSSFAQELEKALLLVATRGVTGAASAPLILIGAGTGIAPLIAGVRRLVGWRREEGGKFINPSYSCFVMYGARNQSELVYHDELTSAYRTGSVSRYEYALSREEGRGEGGKYVTELMERNKAYLRTSLVEGGARLFCCAPAKVLQSIRHLLGRRILADPDDDESMEQQRVLFLESKKQIMFDTWSTNSFF